MGHRPAGSHRGAVDPARLRDVLRGVLMLTGPEAGRPGGVFAVSSCQDPVCFVSHGHDHVHGLGLFLAPEVVDSKGNRDKDQEHSHGNEALHPGLQVPQALLTAARWHCHEQAQNDQAED